MKRVAITGIGIVSCLGNNQSEVYESLINTKSGISFLKNIKNLILKAKFAEYLTSNLKIILIENLLGLWAMDLLIIT